MGSSQNGPRALGQVSLIYYRPPVEFPPLSWIEADFRSRTQQKRKVFLMCTLFVYKGNVVRLPVSVYVGTEIERVNALGYVEFRPEVFEPEPSRHLVRDRQINRRLRRAGDRAAEGEDGRASRGHRGRLGCGSLGCDKWIWLL